MLNSEQKYARQKFVRLYAKRPAASG